MKKLVTLLLVLTGIVSSASATTKTIYVQDNRSLGSMYIHHWGGGSDTAWPGTQVTTTQTIEGTTVYTVEIDTDWTGFIINNNNSQTVDLYPNSYTDGSYYWIQDKNNEEKYAGLTEMARYEYTFNITSPTTLNYIYLYQDGSLNGDWPGAELTNNGDGTYSYTHSSFKDNIYTVVFNQGDGQPQTCNLWANYGTDGVNNYYITGLASSANNDSWGQCLKTNGYGYITTNSYSALTIPEGLAYYATDNGNGSATAHYLTNPASGVPMLIKGNANTIYHIPSASSGSQDVTENAFKQGPESKLDSQTGGKYNYVLNGDTWRPANKVWVDNEKAYLQLSQAVSAHPLIFEDEDITGIKALDNATNSQLDNYYNLQGVKVAKPAKGLYIVNGKKVVMK